MDQPIETLRARYTVRRWTRSSQLAIAAVALLVVGLAIEPLALSTYVTEQLTELYILIILAAMYSFTRRHA